MKRSLSCSLNLLILHFLKTAIGEIKKLDGNNPEITNTGKGTNSIKLKSKYQCDWRVSSILNINILS